MARPVDHARREQLLDAAVDYVVDHGLADLSLRPLAAALHTQAPVLLHHFGSKENLLVQILNAVRDRLRDVARMTGPAEGPSGLRAVWSWASDPAHAPLYRLFFEAYALALRDPDLYRGFLDTVVRDWLDALSPGLGEDVATLLIASMRGLLLDLLTTGDHDRVNTAMNSLEAFVQQRAQD